MLNELSNITPNADGVRSPAQGILLTRSGDVLNFGTTVIDSLRDGGGHIYVVFCGSNA